MAKPAAVKLNFEKFWMVKAPVVSLMPYKLNRIISRDPKYSIEDFFKGAAPKKKAMDWSSPSCYLILFRMR